eukprot:gene9510-biopygen9505
MMPMGQIVCDGRLIPATVNHPLCGCCNCEGGGNARLIASLWAIARSPLLLGGDSNRSLSLTRPLSVVESVVGAHFPCMGRPFIFYTPPPRGTCGVVTEVPAG